MEKTQLTFHLALFVKWYVVCLVTFSTTCLEVDTLWYAFGIVENWCTSYSWHTLVCFWHSWKLMYFVQLTHCVWCDYLIHKFCFVVLTILVSIRDNSLAFFIRSFAFVYSAIHQASRNNHNRYCVSLASLSEIFILCKKSFLLSPSCASLIFAPTLVPDLNNCLAIENSFVIFIRYE